MPPSLDQFDRRLLSAIQQDARLSQHELGERVSLSPAAVNRRLKRLHEEGVIVRQAAIVKPAALGYALSVIVSLEVKSEQLDLLEAMKRRFESCPQVQQCYYVAGEWDFVLIMAVRDMAQYIALSKMLFVDNVQRFKTAVAMESVKVSLAVPCED